MKRFGVIGHPIAHSLSPLLHNTAFSLLGVEGRYEAFDIEPSSLGAAIRDFKEKGFAGLNVTIPHKESILEFLDAQSDESKAIGAVNTLIFDGDRIRGDSTDVYGVAASLEEYRPQIQGSKAVVLGAGGSARAAAFALIGEFSPVEIVIANRSLVRAKQLIADLKPYATRTSLCAVALSDAEVQSSITQASVVVNATSVGMHPAVDQSPVKDQTGFHSGQIVMDLVYTPRETRFLSQASRCGARTISGLEMFLHQGARSLEIWLGLEMPVEQLRPVILNELKSRHT
ncbi:MAG: shikimate dehydrogenase [Ignavibacteriales bacterium]|nr:shikimate dehydrogenase [Ignavibacteriales bacterium]